MKNATSRRLFASALALVMTAGLFTSCQGGGAQTGTTGSASTQATSGTTAAADSGASLTRVAKPVTLTWMITESPDWPLNNPIETWNKVAEATNVTVKWQPMPQADAASVYQTTMASGKSNWPDLVCNKLPTLTTDGENGAFLPLEDLLKDKMPNVLNVMLQDPPNFITVPSAKDGHTYGLPSIGLSRNAMSWMIRGDWLEKLGIKEPETIDEFTDALRAFRDKDPGNAGKNNTPLVIRGGIQSLFVNAMCAWGMHNTIYTLDPQTGTCTVNATTPAFREMCEWLKLLYDEKLIDKEFATADAARWESYISNSYAGATMDYTVRTDQFTKKIQNPGEDAVKAGVVANPDAKFIGLVPLAGPKGNRGIATNSPMNFDNSVAITQNCKDVDAACALINYIYSDEGIKLLSWGQDGVTYKGVDAKGNPQWIDDIGAPGQYSIQKISQYGIQQPFLSRVITDSEVTLAYGKLSMEALEKNRPYWQYPHGPIKWTEEMSQRNGDLMTDIVPTIIQAVAEFMTGARKLDDAGWATFQADLKKLGVDECAETFSVGRKAGNDLAKERLAEYGQQAPEWMLNN